MQTKLNYNRSDRRFNEQEIITRSRQGVLRAEADRVAALVGLTDKEMAFVLGLSASYLHRLDYGIFG